MPRPDHAGRMRRLSVAATWRPHLWDVVLFRHRKRVHRIIARKLAHGGGAHVCGRPGSETDTECEDGWQRIDRPLRICKGKLSTSTRTDGSCFGYYKAVPMANDQRDERDALLAEPWMKDCLSGIPGDAR